jgi:5-formyltetrahydrofolate cyclo-ligase
MNNKTQDLKSALRREARERLREMIADRRAAASAQARALLIAQARWQSAAAVLLYAPMSQEVDMWPLLEAGLAAGKTVALPRFEESTSTYVACRITDLKADVSPGCFGIREPNERCARNEINRLDLILVPGLAFDLQGHRLGKGRGFYDQLLVTLRGTTCGVAFDEQIVPEVPVEPHDIRLDYLLTPTRWVEA